MGNDQENSQIYKMPDGELENNLITSSAMLDDNNIIIVEESGDPNSIGGILNICKRKLVQPYMRFLGLIGLRPLFAERTRFSKVFKSFNLIYNIQVIFFLLLGYFLQYVSCFRRDRGFACPPSRNHLEEYEKECSGSLITGFIVPSLLHFIGYIYALMVFRRSDDNQLLVLIERVFLTSSNVPNMQINQNHIIRNLWVFVISSVLWIFTSITLVNYMMAEGDVTFKWLDPSWKIVQFSLKALLVVCIIWHDIVQATVISNYCLQVQLLKKYVQFIREKLLQHPVRSLEWIRDIEEFRKLLNYLNDQVAPAVCILTLINWTYAISGTLWLVAFHNDPHKDVVPLYTVVNVLNVVLWWVIAVAPFIQAARLTLSCNNVKTVGQEVRTRPFVHQDTPVQELNSILIYTSSLKIHAKLFNLPINGKYTGITFAILTIFFLVLGQSRIINDD
ncbi:hypothetical protein ABEB36_012029 [Hypothenemus hampei]|uniref:Gustatory receptor n=1 Tax=Hypothenemus hampei TaxID=57062 RepID=A0ABD1E9X6_HYPHA